MDQAAAVERIKAYYACLDDGRYDRLRELLHPSFEQVRPDRRFADRERFLTFMREERPIQASSHELQDVFTAVSGEPSRRIAAQGHLAGPDGERLFGFVDVHTFNGDRIARLSTYTD